MCHRLDAKRGTRPNAPSLRGADRQQSQRRAMGINIRADLCIVQYAILPVVSCDCQTQLASYPICSTRNALYNTYVRFCTQPCQRHHCLAITSYRALLLSYQICLPPGSHPPLRSESILLPSAEKSKASTLNGCALETSYWLCMPLVLEARIHHHRPSVIT